MTTVNVEAHLYELLKDFSTAMLVTTDSDGRLHARPMSIAELKPDAEMYFAAQLGSPKVMAISANSTALVTFQSSSEYASLTGTASIVNDRALIARFWSEAWRVWFPAGKEDSNLILIRFDPNTAEYWDNSGAEGVKYLYEGLKAYLQGRQPDVDPAVNAKVRLGG
jgi:general stress protein 26